MHVTIYMHIQIKALVPPPLGGCITYCATALTKSRKDSKQTNCTTDLTLQVRHRPLPASHMITFRTSGKTAAQGRGRGRLCCVVLLCLLAVFVCLFAVCFIFPTVIVKMCVMPRQGKRADPHLYPLRSGSASSSVLYH